MKRKLWLSRDKVYGYRLWSRGRPSYSTNGYFIWGGHRRSSCLEADGMYDTLLHRHGVFLKYGESAEIQIDVTLIDKEERKYAAASGILPKKKGPTDD